MSAIVLGIFAAFMALELPLLVIRKLFPQTEGVLPLGGDEFNQVAILLMSALFTVHIVLGMQFGLKILRKRRNKAVRNTGCLGRTASASHLSNRRCLAHLPVLEAGPPLSVHKDVGPMMLLPDGRSEACPSPPSS